MVPQNHMIQHHQQQQHIQQQLAANNMGGRPVIGSGVNLQQQQQQQHQQHQQVFPPMAGPPPHLPPSVSQHANKHGSGRAIVGTSTTQQQQQGPDMMRMFEHQQHMQQYMQVNRNSFTPKSFCFFYFLVKNASWVYFSVPPTHKFLHGLFPDCLLPACLYQKKNMQICKTLEK